MNTLNANDLKVGGVGVIETALQDADEVAIAVRGERRYVVMSVDHYRYLRESELLAAWAASKADVAAGRGRTMTVAEHLAEMGLRIDGSRVEPQTVQQEPARYKAAKPDATKKPASKRRTPVSKLHKS